MSARNSRWTATSSVCLLLLSSACFHTTAPKGWLPTATEAQRDAYGGWIKLDYTVSGNRLALHGELIAAAPDSVHVLTSEGMVAVPTATVISGTLTTYDANYGGLRLWAIFGGVSTLSHGIGLVFTMPLWAIAGSVATASASKAPRVESTNPTLLRMYARFPQGIPPGLDLRSLRQKDVRTLVGR